MRTVRWKDFRAVFLEKQMVSGARNPPTTAIRVSETTILCQTLPRDGGRPLPWYPNVPGGLTPFPQTFLVVVPSGQITWRDKGLHARALRVKLCRDARDAARINITEVADSESAISLTQSCIEARGGFRLVRSRRDLNFEISPLKYSNAGLYHGPDTFVSSREDGRITATAVGVLEEKPRRLRTRTKRCINSLGCVRVCVCVNKGHSFYAKAHL